MLGGSIDDCPLQNFGRNGIGLVFFNHLLKFTLQRRRKYQQVVALLVKECLVGIPLFGFNSSWDVLFTLIGFTVKRCNHLS